MMNERTNFIYRDWLVRKVKDGSKYQWMLWELFTKEFIWLIPNDDNRRADCWDLRYAFRDEKGENIYELIPYSTMLETVVALSRRLEFQARNGSAREWALILLENIELTKYKGHITKQDKTIIDGILDRVIWRQYEPSGLGGFFPLAWPTEDQRKVEIWYQMSAYLQEQFTM